MKKKKSVALAGLGVLIVLTSIMIYWFYFSKPSSFPIDERLVREINDLYPNANAEVIQETIPVDDRHVAVPFISDENEYGLSYWVWKMHKWTVATVDTKGQPKIWKINKNDPSSYYLVWNSHPEDRLSSIHFYLMRNRGYRVTDGKERYDPKVQIEKQISLKEKTYVVQKLPDEWVKFMNSLTKVESAKQLGQFFHNMYSARDIFFGWISFDQSGKEAYPEHSVNGSEYSNGDLDIDYMMILNNSELD